MSTIEVEVAPEAVVASQQDAGGRSAGSHLGGLTLPKVSLVIPTLNEARNMPHVLPRIPAWLHELVIVDGHSTDNTPETVRALYPRARIVMAKQRGKGSALRAGFLAATGDIIVTADGDGSMDPAEMIRFVAALVSGADFAKGSRFIQGGGTADMSLVRMVGNWGLMHVLRVICGGGFSDLCYGYNAFWRCHLEVLNIDCDGFEIETALSLSALKANLKIVEVPSFEAARVHGQSNLNAITDGWRVLMTILRESLTPRVSVASQ